MQHSQKSYTVPSFDHGCPVKTDSTIASRIANRTLTLQTTVLSVMQASNTTLIAQNHLKNGDEDGDDTAACETVLPICTQWQKFTMLRISYATTVMEP